MKISSKSKNIRVVLIPVDYNKSRKVCEHIENMVFPTIVKCIEFIKKELDEEINGADILFFHLTNFMDEVNDQYLDNLGEYFISYVEITK